MDKYYLEFVKNEVKESIQAALKNKKSAKIKFAKYLTGAKKLVTDTRDAMAFDMHSMSCK